MEVSMFDYKWYLKDGYPAPGIEAHNLKVFGTFICGGGSTMGYKLAGYHHIGGVELDPNIAKIYRKNHNPEHLFCEDIRDFNAREDLPPELYDLDILDGSPPCSTFSTAGSREAAWGKEKQFAEGQKMQRLDDLVFVYCETIKKLRPKVFILENVSGLIKGNAKSYMARIMATMKEAGYESQVFLLDAQCMGVPQVRKRVFVIGRRKDLGWPLLRLNFNQKPIPFGRIIDRSDTSANLEEMQKKYWPKRKKGDRDFADIYQRERGKYSGFTQAIISSDKVCPTITTGTMALWDYPRRMNAKEYALASSFPLDYDFQGKAAFLCGMSVPPVMTANIAYEIYKQWFKVNKSTL